jgi:N-ethylmaleimide reductase
MSPLFTPTRIGAIDCATRIVMAPLTRNRAVEGNVPSPLAPTYYAQRADPATGAALIVSEATQVCWEGRGYLHAPGIHTPEQVAGWRRVTDAVHARGGRIVAQLWHVGRVSHASLQPGGQPPVSSTDVAAKRKAYTAEGLVPCSPPRALREDELPGVVAQFAHGARCAMDAGFDGVEVHAANGYLIDQFLRDTVNRRSDGYGGSIERRARLLLEVMHAVAAEVGGDRTGVRLSPANPLPCGAPDSQAQALFEHALEALAPLGLAFVHVIEGQTGGARDAWPFDYAALRARFAGAWIVNNGYTQELAEEAVASGRADAVAFGKPFIANPDLARRFRVGAPLAAADTKTYYESGDDPARGYTDYPALGEVAPSAPSTPSAAAAVDA